MTKNLTIRIPEETYNKLSENEEGMTGAILSIIEEHYQLLKRSELEIKGKFSESEWTALIDLVNSQMLLPEYVCLNSLLIATIEDGEKFERALSRHGAKLDQMIEKVKTLTAAQTAAMAKRAKRFWANPENKLEEWVRF